MSIDELVLALKPVLKEAVREALAEIEDEKLRQRALPPWNEREARLLQRQIEQGQKKPRAYREYMATHQRPINS
jgi:hypothetical protein